MTPILEDAALSNDLDCQNFVLRNVMNFFPVPPGLVDKDDPALGDPRVPPIASVTDESVNAAANIQQGKLSLDGVIPTPWLTTPGHTPTDSLAARGDMVERVSRKGTPSGYAALDSNGKLPPSSVPATAAPGTVTSVQLQMPAELPVIAGSPIVTTGAFTVPWADIPDQTWFGVHSVGMDSVPRPSPQSGSLPPELVSALDASNFTSGVFLPELLPVAAGMGSLSSKGAVPDPGEFGLPTDYLGRDMLWHTFAPDINVQPTCPTPLITLESWSEDKVMVTVCSKLPGSSLFIRINNGPFKQSKKMPPTNELFGDVYDTVSVQDGDTIWAYAAKAGYNNSGFDQQSQGHTNPWKVKTPLTIIP